MLTVALAVACIGIRAGVLDDSDAGVVSDGNWKTLLREVSVFTGGAANLNRFELDVSNFRFGGEVVVDKLFCVFSNSLRV